MRVVGWAQKMDSDSKGFAPITNTLLAIDRATPNTQSMDKFYTIEHFQSWLWYLVLRQWFTVVASIAYVHCDAHTMRSRFSNMATIAGHGRVIIFMCVVICISYICAVFVKACSATNAHFVFQLTYVGQWPCYISPHSFLKLFMLGEIIQSRAKRARCNASHPWQCCRTFTADCLAVNFPARWTCIHLLKCCPRQTGAPFKAGCSAGWSGVVAAWANVATMWPRMCPMPFRRYRGHLGPGWQGQFAPVPRSFLYLASRSNQASLKRAQV